MTRHTISYVERLKRGRRGHFLRAVVKRRSIVRLMTEAPLLPEWARDELREAMRQRDAAEAFMRALPVGYALDCDGRLVRRRVEIRKWGLWTCEVTERVDVC